MTHSTWVSVVLRDVASFSSGKTPSRSRQADYFDGGNTPWVKTLDLNNSSIFKTDERITQRAIQDSGLAILPVGTVLVAMYGGFNQIGRTGLLRVPAATNQAITAILPNSRRLNSSYLLHVLNHRIDYWRTVASSSRKDPNITKADVKAFPLALPPLTEQNAVAAALDDADDLIVALERLIAKKQAIKQGVMQQLLTGRKRLPGFSATWTTLRLSDLGTFLKGRGVKRDDVQASGVPCIRYGELYTDFINHTAFTKSFVTTDVAKTATPIRSGDLLFAGSGETREEIGMCVAYVGDAPAVAGGDILILRGSTFNPIYLATLSNLPDVANQKARAGQGDAVVHISSRALSAITVSIPSKVEQDAIAEVLTEADAELRKLRLRLSKTREIKTGMMQQLLTGCTRLPLVEAAS